MRVHACVDVCSRYVWYILLCECVPVCVRAHVGVCVVGTYSIYYYMSVCVVGTCSIIYMCVVGGRANIQALSPGNRTGVEISRSAAVEAQVCVTVHPY